MINRVRVVTGYVPLKVQHMNPLEFHAHGDRLDLAVGNHCKMTVFRDFPYEKCWLAKEDPPRIGGNPRAEDRFASDEEHVRSNVVCNQFVEWAWQAYKKHPKTDVIVALTYTVMKQGAFTGKPVEAKHIGEFLERVKTYEFNDIPFPGITLPGTSPWTPLGHNWRFCGSTHIWPTKWLREIRDEYKECARSYIEIYGRTPLDLAIWPLVEDAPDLPFRWYQAEYDATQFTNFPGVSP